MSELKAAPVKVLVSGATGYVGSRLVPRLLNAGYFVKATSRSLDKLLSRPWAMHPNLELVQLDMKDKEAVEKAIADCTHVYYLVHSMNPLNHDFAHADRVAALNMAEACGKSHLRQIIYLGGLGEESDNLSKHLSSRAEVAHILGSGATPVTILRAAMIIGSGSASFEILRYLVDRLPIMVTPRWVHTRSQPISIRNVLHYLIGCLDNEATFGATFDIGGPEILTYKDLMCIYAERAGLRPRIIISVPVFTPRLSSYWIHLVTPVPAYIARPLAEGLRNPTICINNDIRDLLPQRLLTAKEAIDLAINRLQHQQIESHWTDAGTIRPSEWCMPDDPEWAGGTLLVDERFVTVGCTAEEAWQPIVQLGGVTGYYYADWLWALRGLIDKLLGGVGLRRGRRDLVDLRTGDALDFWRVKQVQKNKSLVLIAEMKLPGQAVLEFELETATPGVTRIRQIAKFLPAGLEGILYWFSVLPLHNLIFNGMLKGIASATAKPLLTGPERVN
ncbi:MAG: SDR family oxidoreductase [Candidatus Obscuribacterales bacterium]|nr:SDR family oxidoreductase [Candidatus Obscuribacterales bacterium]